MLMQRISIVVILLCSLSFWGSAFAQVADYDVLSYEINLDVEHKQENRHIGFTKLRLNILSSESDILEFDLKNHIVDSVKVNGQNVEFTYNNAKITVAMGRTLLQGELVEVEVYYNGGMVLEPYAWGGIHYEPHIVYTLGIAFSDYPHSYARSWFACKDAFTDKATFKFNITVNKDVRAVCGGVLDSITSGETYDTYHWSINQEIPAYLASMTVANFKLLERNLQSNGREVPLQVYYFANDSVSVYENFANFEAAFAKMEDCFGNFAFNRVGYCTTTQGSMEHVDNISLAHSLAASVTANSQSVIVHEFGHSWFGNLMTCKTPGDMWINEGWTTFTEKLSLEAMYGVDYAKKHFRTKAEKVLKTLPRTEGVFPLHGVDSTLTYSSTVYDKGALVAMTLKAYMGDSLFYSSVQKLLSDFAFSNIDSQTMRDSLSSYSGIDLTAFFDAYVFDTIMHNFEITHFESEDNSAKVKIRSRTKDLQQTPFIYTRIPITFMDSNFNAYKCQMIDNGNQELHSFTLPFNPATAFLDLDEEYFDLTTDSYEIITERGLCKFPSSYLNIYVNECTDSVLIRPTLHWIGEEENAERYGVDRFSKKHYWTIEGVNLDKADITARFYYQFSNLETAFDNSLIYTREQLDSLLLLYRPNAESEWENVEIEKPSSLSGYISVPLRKGDYIMAVGDKDKVGLSACFDSDNQLKVYPQPSNGKLNVEFPKLNKKSTLKIIDSVGHVIYSTQLEKGLDNKQLELAIPNGTYVIIIELDDKVISQTILKN